jgi:Ulp1 family protease
VPWIRNRTWTDFLQVQQQGNDYDCGLHLVQNAELVIKNLWRTGVPLVSWSIEARLQDVNFSSLLVWGSRKFVPGPA